MNSNTNYYRENSEGPKNLAPLKFTFFQGRKKVVCTWYENLKTILFKLFRQLYRV